MKMVASVEEYIEQQEEYGEMLEILRDTILKTELQEAVKWGMPTYTLKSKNVVSINAFKNYCGVWFFSGVFLSDPYNILYNAQKGKTKGLRQLRFTKTTEINKNIILEYVYEAIENQKKGLEIKLEKKPLRIPIELKALFNENKKLSAIFDSLTLTKRREFANYISNAKKEETKQKRIEKIIPMLLNNIGLSDKYR